MTFPKSLLATLSSNTSVYIDVPECFPADIERFSHIHVSGMTCNMDIGVLDPAVELDPQPSLEGGARSRQQQ